MAQRRILIVANRTAGGHPLIEAVRERMRATECSCFLLSPATPAPGGFVWEERAERQGAAERLEVALQRLEGIGARVEGKVGGHDPYQAVMDELRQHEYDEILVSTYPQGISEWLKLDLPSRIARSFAGPVTHIISHE